MIVNGSLNLQYSSISSLGNIKKVKGFVSLLGCINLKSLGNIKFIMEDLTANDELESLGELEEVKGDLRLQRCKNLKSLENLLKVKGFIYLENSGVTKEYVEKEKPNLLKRCRW